MPLDNSKFQKRVCMMVPDEYTLKDFDQTIMEDML